MVNVYRIIVYMRTFIVKMLLLVCECYIVNFACLIYIIYIRSGMLFTIKKYFIIILIVFCMCVLNLVVGRWNVHIYIYIVSILFLFMVKFASQCWKKWMVSIHGVTSGISTTNSIVVWKPGYQGEISRAHISWRSGQRLSTHPVGCSSQAHPYNVGLPNDS